MPKHPTALVFLVAAVFFLVGCTIPFNRRNFHLSHSAGVQAVERGDWTGARRHFKRALKNAEAGQMDSATLAEARFNYARALGSLCRFSEAEGELLEALKLAGEEPGGKARYKKLKIHAELGLLNHARGKYSRALSFYEDALPLGEEAPSDEDFRRVYLEMLENFSISLDQTGKHGKAETIKKELAEKHQEFIGTEGFSHPPSPQKFRYPKKCDKEGELPIGHHHHQH